MASFEIAKYTITLTDRGDYGWIMLFDKNGKYRARLNFSNDPPSDAVVSGTFIQVRMHSSMFNRSVDLIRNEGPTNFYWFKAWAGIACGDEPAGEGEYGGA
jgi:hypothetical protein